MKSKIPIVDEDDKILTYKERGTLNNEDIYRVTGLIVKNLKDEILLAKRVKTKKKHPSKWSVSVAGTVEEKETYDSNMKKEAFEELGLENLNFIKLKKVRVTDNPYNLFIQFYEIVINENLDFFKIQEDEVEQIRWFSKEEIKLLLKEKPDMFTPSFCNFILEFL